MKNRALSLQLLFCRRNSLHSSPWQRAAGLAGLFVLGGVLGCAYQRTESVEYPRPASSLRRLLPPPPTPPLAAPLKTPPPVPPRPLAATPTPPQSPVAAPVPTPAAATASAPASEHETTAAIPLQVLAGAVEPLHADDPTLPDQVLMASRGKVLEGSYKLCIARDGRVQSVTPVVGIEGVDRCVVETLKTWQFPKLPVLLCKLQTLRFEIP